MFLSPTGLSKLASVPAGGAVATPAAAASGTAGAGAAPAAGTNTPFRSSLKLINGCFLVAK